MTDLIDSIEIPSKALLEVNNIEVIYNHVILVLRGVSLKVPKGGITALLGGNGAGTVSYTHLRAHETPEQRGIGGLGVK